MRILGLEIKKIISSIAVSGFILLCLVFNMLISYDSGRFVQNNVAPTNIFEGYQTSYIAESYIQASSLNGKIAENMREKYEQMQPIVEQKAQNGDSLGQYDYRQHENLFRAIMQPLLIEGIILAVLIMLLSLGNENINHTDLQYLCAVIGVSLGVTDYAGYRALESKILYFSLAPSEDEIEKLLSGELSFGDDYDPYDPKKDYTLTKAEEKYASGASGNRNDLSAPKYKLDFFDHDIFGAYSGYITFLSDFDLYDWGVGASRIKEIAFSDAMLNIMPTLGLVPAQTFVFLSLLILVTASILFAPVATRDNMSGVRTMQYSSKTGRNALRVQLCALLATVFIISVIEISIFMAIYIHGAWGNFLDSGLHSFLTKHTKYSWFMGTFGQWICCCALLIFIVSVAATFFVFCISLISKNYISLILGLVPTLVALAVICIYTFDQPFAIKGGGLYRYIPIPFVEVYVCGLLIAIGAVWTMILLKRQKSVEG